MSAIPLIDNLLESDLDNNVASVLILAKQNIAELHERLRADREALGAARRSLLRLVDNGFDIGTERDALETLRLIEPLLSERKEQG